ncbi:MAG: thioredoxin family protein [Planctomycetota bacterium]
MNTKAATTVPRSRTHYFNVCSGVGLAILGCVIGTGCAADQFGNNWLPLSFGGKSQQAQSADNGMETQLAMKKQESTSTQNVPGQSVASQAARNQVQRASTHYDPRQSPSTQLPAQRGQSMPVQRVAARRAIPTLHTLGPQDNLNQLVQQAPGVVILDFYADWCGPCKTLGRTFHHLEERAAQNNATVIKIDIEKFPQLKERFQAERLPTLVVLKNGRQLKRHVGAPNSQTLSQWFAL